MNDCPNLYNGNFKNQTRAVTKEYENKIIISLFLVTLVNVFLFILVKVEILLIFNNLILK